MTLTFHGFAPSTFVQSARLIATEKSADHEIAPLEFHQPSHYALHPFGKMPAMDHDGTRLFEVAAIAVYLDETFGGPSLQPADTLAKARMWQLISAGLHYGYSALVSHTLGDDGLAGTDQKAVAAFLDFINGELDGKAASPKIADFYLLPMVRHHIGLAGREPVFSGRPVLESWYDAMMSRKSAQAVFED